MNEHAALCQFLTAYTPRLNPDPPRYEAAHARVTYHRGRASGYLCTCGQPAEDWAYDHADRSEVTGVSKDGHVLTYSNDIAHYLPMCRPCHRRFDAEFRRSQRSEAVA